MKYTFVKIFSILNNINYGQKNINDNEPNIFIFPIDGYIKKFKDE